MHLRTVHIDFENRSLTAEVGPSDTAWIMSHFVGFVKECRMRRIEDIRLVCRAGMTNLQMIVIREIASRCGAVLLPGHEEPLPSEPNGSLNALSLWVDPTTGKITYVTQANSLETAVDQLTSATLLISYTSDLDEIARGHLRLCIYELAMNSCEHGRFDGPVEIELSGHVDDRGAHITYTDNAGAFTTERTSSMDIGAKIATQHKRGLGLYIINRISSFLEYKRVDDRNVTNLTIEHRKRGRTTTRRRTEMETLTIEIAPCKIENAAILRPIGSIDSSTTIAVESQMNAMIAQGIKYIIVDLSQVDFISSSGVGIFLGTVSQLRAEGGDIIFMKMPPQIEDVFEIINLKSYFVSVNDVSEIETTKQP